MALPTIATIFDFDIATTNLTISEEESQHAPLVINEKSLPKVLDLSDFKPYFGDDLSKRSFQLLDDSINRSPYLSIFSPPPQA